MPATAGGHQGAGTSSVSTFLSTLIPVGLVAAVVFGIFLLYRTKIKRVYEPRTYLPLLDKHERTPQPSNSKLGWIKDFFAIDDDFVLGHSSLDNFLFLRFFKIMFVICLFGTLLTWPILFPINATGGVGKNGFNKISFSNIATPSHTNYYYAHAIIAWIFIGFIMVVITRETVLFINLRQSIMTSVAYKTRMSSKTVLFTYVDHDFLSESKLRDLFPGVLRVWFQHDTKELDDIVDERDQAFTKLETAENKMCQTFVKDRKKAEKKGKGDDIPLVDNERAHIEVNKKIRPTHRLGKIPLIGKKVDTIEWARPELQSLNKKVSSNITKTQQSERISAVFVEFESLEFAQAAYRQTSSKGKQNLSPRALGVQPEDVKYKNLGNKKMMDRLILIASTIFVTLLVIFWAIPTAFVGAISNIGTLEEISFLTWIQSIPEVILGVVSGLLPSIMLAVLMALVPIIMRLLAGLFEPTLSAVELKTQSWYFAFQIVDVFLITTFSSGAASVGQQIANDPTSAPALLAQNLPLASNFYTAYFVIVMLMKSALTVLNVVPLLFALVLGKILDKTPRKVYNRYTNMAGLGWGSVYPAFAMLGCIAIAYSCIAPLLLGFATVGFGLLYLAYRYQFLYVIGSQSIDMKGRAYARALQQLMAGVYLLEFCLIGLFAINTASSALTVGPLIITIILAIATVIYHFVLTMTLKPIINYTELPPSSENSGKYLTPHDADENDKGTVSPTMTNSGSTTALTTAPHSGLRGKLLHFFFNSQFAEKFFTVRKQLPSHFDYPIRPYTEDECQEAFQPASMLDEEQVVWIARDEYGLSRQEVAGCEQFEIPASDAEAVWNEKAKVQWDETRATDAPIYDERVPY